MEGKTLKRCLLILWLVLSIGASIAAGLWIHWKVFGHRIFVRNPEVPQVVETFLTEYIGEEWKISGVEGGAFFKYFKELEGLTTDDFYDNWGVSPVDDTIHMTFEMFISETPSGFELEPITDNFCIVRLVKEDGEHINPPIGFWYTITSDGEKIDKWSVARLLPFSRYDEDFSKVWDDQYGQSVS